MSRRLPASVVVTGAAAFLCSLLHCGSGPVAAGNTSGGEARAMAGRAVIGTAPAANAAVRLRPAGYVTPLSSALPKDLRAVADTVTDDSGRFTIDSVDTGRYFLEINDLRSNAALLACTLEAGAGTRQLPTLSLKPFASIRGSIDYAGKNPGAFFVQMYGLERLLPVDSNGVYQAVDLPAGTYTLRLVASDSTSLKPATIPAVTAAADSLTIVSPFAAWRFSRRIVINTSASGAGVTQDVDAFPLLVRLDGSDFDFSQARDSGGDLRFVKADGSPMPYEIEQWDRPAGQAALWVRIDTVRGNDAAQSFTMLWGNPNAASLSDGRAVFDTAGGCIGVWHLGDPGVSVRKNSAEAAFAARPANYTGDESAPGVIGPCDSLDSLDHDTLGVINTAAITLSAWVNPSRLEPFARIITRADTGPNFHNYALNLDSAAQLAEGAIATNQGGFSMQSTSMIPTGSWTHLCLTYDGAQVVLYVNGIQENAQAATGPLNSHAENAFLGWNRNYAGYQKLVGKIDEARIDGTARSAAWVKLSYQNQQAGSGIVEFK